MKSQLKSVQASSGTAQNEQSRAEHRQGVGAAALIFLSKCVGGGVLHGSASEVVQHPFLHDQQQPRAT